jgi:hypothetical protein
MSRHGTCCWCLLRRSGRGQRNAAGWAAAHAHTACYHHCVLKLMVGGCCCDAWKHARRLAGAAAARVHLLHLLQQGARGPVLVQDSICLNSGNSRNPDLSRSSWATSRSMSNVKSKSCTAIAALATTLRVGTVCARIIVVSRSKRGLDASELGWTSGGS